MKLCKIIIPNFNQFENFELDLTYPASHPNAGEPMDKICLIGQNGTGKSTLLKLIYDLFYDFRQFRWPCLIICLIKINGEYIYVAISSSTSSENIYLKKEIDNIPDWISKISSKITAPFNTQINININEFSYTNSSIINNIPLRPNANDLLIYSPPEDVKNLYYNINDVPKSSLNEALALFDSFPFHHLVSAEQVNSFWKLLIFLIKKRDNDFQKFQDREENQEKSVRDVKVEFEESNPNILFSLGELWNQILDKAGLEFDTQNASNPIQLNDNLKVYIKSKHSDQKIKYSNLSTGIRNFIFRVGHIFSLYFNRQIERGFLLIDEPENSLFPDFLYDLVETYFDIAKNTQLVMATHSPIIAAQFEPFERIILDFNDEGKVFYKNGNMPIGDDPNDILIKDFGIKSLFGKEGMKNWERYKALHSLIRKEEDKQLKNKFIAEYLDIGTRYNFPGNEIH